MECKSRKEVERGKRCKEKRRKEVDVLGRRVEKRREEKRREEKRRKGTRG